MEEFERHLQSWILADEIKTLKQSVALFSVAISGLILLGAFLYIRPVAISNWIMIFLIIVWSSFFYLNIFLILIFFQSVRNIKRLRAH